MAYKIAKVENATRFDRAVNTFVSTLQNRMTVYSMALVGARNLMQIEKDVSAKQFETFLIQMGIKENFPGIQAIGYVERLSIQESRRRLKSMGLPFEYAQTPPGSSAASLTRYSVGFQQGATRTTGLDMGVTKDLRAAMDRARDTGQLIATDRAFPLTLPQNGLAGAFLMFMPVYKSHQALTSVEERRRQLKGFVYGSFRSENLFGRLTKELHDRDGNFSVQVFDGPNPTAENRMYTEGGEGSALSNLKASLPFTFGDHTWTIQIIAPKAFLIPYLHWTPYLIFAFGFFSSLLIALVLQHSQALEKEAAAANQAKSVFLANISHEIRTPLGVMLGFAEIALGQSSQIDRETSLKTIIKNGKELTRIIGDVLDVSKIEANKLKIEKSSFSLTKLAEDLVAIWKPQAEAKGLAFELDMDPEIRHEIRHEILGDETRIKQILTNVLSNATKFTAQGFIRLSIAVDQEFLRISVSDSGIGVSAENQQKLFRPFSQGDSSITRKFGGSGLGLALSREIARALGGSLELLESKENQGSQFVLTIPHEQIVSAHNSQSPASEKPCSSLAGKNILLVEDSADNRALFSIMLKRANATVDLAQDGQEGVDKAMSQKYDLVLMDIQMPIKDGYTAFAELKEKNYRIPVIALTAHALTDEKNKALDMGFADYLTKPVDYRTLIQTAHRLTLGREQA